MIILAESVLNYSNSLKTTNLGTECVYVYFIKQDSTFPLCLQAGLILQTRVEVLQAGTQTPRPAARTSHLTQHLFDLIDGSDYTFDHNKSTTAVNSVQRNRLQKEDGKYACY